MALQPIILAGGSGTRLWPLSREHYPKPFLTLTGERSLFQEALCRLDGIEGIFPPIIVCNEEHRFLVSEHTSQVGQTPSSIILEPVGRNTAPALTLAALMLADQCAEQGSENPVMLVMPADHLIEDVATFQAVVQQGAALAERGCLVTFGVVPTSPKSAYGYIERGAPYAPESRAAVGEAGDAAKHNPSTMAAYRLDAFVEKPDTATAEGMLRSGRYLWNSGIFIMRASVWLQQLERYRPDVAESCRSAHAGGYSDGVFFRPDAEIFAACPRDTIDYAVMEKVAGTGTPKGGGTGPGPSGDGASPVSPDCVVIPMEAGWSDIGAWSVLWEHGQGDSEGNVTQGAVYSHAMRNSLLISQHRLLAAVGLEDVIAVETADAVLVAHKDRVQEVKDLVERLKLDGRQEQENHRKVHRPWGSYETVDQGPRFKVKRLTIKPGAALSLQKHHHRAEHWVVVKGTAKVTKGDEVFTLTENESAYVPFGVVHRLENMGSTPLEIIEVQSGDDLSEDDIVRFEDRYNRHREKRPTTRTAE